MEVLTIIYLVYTFIAFYLLNIYIITYIQNKREINHAPEIKKNYSLSIVVPCYNEEQSIGKNIMALLSSDYPNLKKIIIVDDCSTDSSYKIIKEFAKKYPQVIALRTPKNTGCAGGAKNFGAKYADTELIGFSDADSFPDKCAISKMVGYFNDKDVGAVTSRVLVKNKNNFLSKIQAIEYKVIAFTRKILEFLDSIYVTNGPLSIYRIKAFKQTGFDEKNLTEDIELTWNVVSRGWKVKISMPAIVYTVVPEKISKWFKQRLRWNVGGMQTVQKYYKKITKCGMLGLFVIPLFTISWILGLSGLFFLGYRIFQWILVRYLSAKFAFAYQISIVSAEQFNLNPSILFFLGIVLISLGMAFTFAALFYSKEKSRTSILDIFIYAFFYLLMYPPLLIISFYKLIKKDMKW